MYFNKPVRLRVQITADELTIIAEPNKGDPDEEDALQAVEHLVRMLRGNAITHKTFDRNTSVGDRVDMVAIRIHR